MPSKGKSPHSPPPGSPGSLGSTGLTGLTGLSSRAAQEVPPTATVFFLGRKEFRPPLRTFLAAQRFTHHRSTSGGDPADRIYVLDQQDDRIHDDERNRYDDERRTRR